MTMPAQLISSICLSSLFTMSWFMPSHAAPAPRTDFYQIKVYLLASKAQEDRLDRYLQNAWLPALHRAGVSKVGVFKPLANDTAAVRRVYLFIPFSSEEQWKKLPGQLQKDNQYQLDGKDYIDASYTDPPYQRIESILLQAFEGMPSFAVPDLKSASADRIYELRSYEGATEKIHQNKVTMFNQGDEISLFKRLGFNAIFYAEVISGGHMPNLMYMTSFENMADHDARWKSFGSDPAWKTLSAMPEYQNNVSHIDIVLMHPAAYSDL
jgi:NIPSNAP